MPRMVKATLTLRGNDDKEQVCTLPYARIDHQSRKAYYCKGNAIN